MFRKLSLFYDNGQRMDIHPLPMNHAPPVVFVKWQRSEHDCSFLRYETCSVSCHRLMKTFRAWLFIPKVWHMLSQLSSSNDKDQSIQIYSLGINHAPSVVIVSWQRSEHCDISLRYESCSVNCHRLMTTDRAWWYIHQVWSMLCQLSSSHDNGQNMVIHP